MATQLTRIHGSRNPRVKAIRDWLLQLEVLRYAPGKAGRDNSELTRLRRELKRLTWPT
jgi:hypothetical protein